jgi:hypothetical protein
MTLRTVTLILITTAVLVGIAGLLFDSAPPTPEPATPVAIDTPTPPPSTPRAEPGRPATPQGWEVELGGQPEFVSEELPAAPQRDRLEMRIAEKLAPEPLSEVPHALVGAWDDLPDSDQPGAHRTIVAVVDAEMSSNDLERFVRDIRDRHIDAEILDIRVYDSEAAATRSGYRDGGAERATHLVADVKRNDRLDYDQIKVRGEILAP